MSDHMSDHSVNPSRIPSCYAAVLAGTDRLTSVSHIPLDLLNRMDLTEVVSMGFISFG